MLLVMVLSGTIAWRVAKSITVPLSQLISVAGQIGNAGDLEQKVDITGEDEVAQLARTFNNMVQYLREMAESLKRLPAAIYQWKSTRALRVTLWARPSGK